VAGRWESCFGLTFYVIGMADVLGVPLIHARYEFGGLIDTLYKIDVPSTRDQRSDVQSTSCYAKNLIIW
jgi:hypothetical protein